MLSLNFLPDVFKKVVSSSDMNKSAYIDLHVRFRAFLSDQKGIQFLKRNWSNFWRAEVRSSINWSRCTKIENINVIEAIIENTCLLLWPDGWIDTWCLKITSCQNGKQLIQKPFAVYSFVLNTSHGTLIQDTSNFPPNPFIPTWSLSKKFAMSTIPTWS